MHGVYVYLSPLARHLGQLMQNVGLFALHLWSAHVDIVKPALGSLSSQ